MEKPTRHVLSRHSLTLLGLGSAGLVLRLAWLSYTHLTSEDAFITFRYAAQVAAGNGMVYNVGERVQGTTTPLFTLMIAAWLKLSSNVVLGARILDLFAWVGSLLCLTLALRYLRATPAQQFFTLATLVIATQLVPNELGGMETPWLAFLMAASWAAMCAKKPLLSGLLCGLLLWVRLDMAVWPLCLGLLLLFTLVSQTRETIAVSRPKTWKQILVFSTGTAAVILPWLAFAWVYYGSPVPHTFLAKQAAYAQTSTLPYTAELGPILAYMTPFSISGDLPWVSNIFAGLTLGLGAWQTWRRRREPNYLVLPAFFVGETMLLTFTRATVFERYFFSAFWVAMVMAGLALGDLWDMLGGVPAKQYRFAFLAVLLAWLGFGGYQWVDISAVYRTSHDIRHEGALTAMGKWLQQNTSPNTVVQLEPLGYVGYYSQRIMRDEVGLVTPQVTALKRAGLTESTDYPSFLHPDILIEHCDDIAQIWIPLESPAGDYFRDHYRFTVRFDPLQFDPDHLTGDNPVDLMARNSCYEIWSLQSSTAVK